MDEEMLEEIDAKPNHLADAAAPTRAIILKSLPRVERQKVVDSLVESAMAMGLVDDNQIKQWLGVDIGLKSIGAAREKITKKWLEETDNIVDYAKTQRAMQIKKAWDEVRICEKMFDDSNTIDAKVKVKQLQLQWLQFISKLSFVDKMLDGSTPDTQIVVQGGLAIQEKNETGS